MLNAKSFLYTHTQNNKLAIRLISPEFGQVSPEKLSAYGLTHRKNFYFFIFMLEGTMQHGVDLHKVELKKDELLFILPHQIHQLPTSKQGTDYFKLGFDENCLSLLPEQYSFLVNPFNNQQIQFASSESSRIISIFKLLRELLSDSDTDHDLILAHLNSLLTEINAAYFSADSNPADEKLLHYIHFKQFVENNLTDQPTIKRIAEELALNTNSLYNIVKHYSKLSPKEFITNRLILETKRRLYYSESSSIKELAYDLGFNDPDYFSRFFKKETGQTVSGFIQDFSGD